MSLIDPDRSARDDWGRRARKLLLHVIDRAADGVGEDGDAFRAPNFATFDRSRWQGEAFGLTVDWAYPYFDDADKAKIRSVFLRWTKEQYGAYPLTELKDGTKPVPAGRSRDARAAAQPQVPALVAQQLLHRAHAQPGADGAGARPGGRSRREAAWLVG